MRVLSLVLALFANTRNAGPTIAPERSRDVALINYAFNGLPPADVAVSARTEVWTIRNGARALHQIQMLHLADSSSLPAVDQWIARGASPLLPPAPLAVNVAALLPGASTTQRVNLQAGVYVVLCFVPAGRDSSGTIVSHAHLGMRQTFVVRP
jgi:hypothetical protein